MITYLIRRVLIGILTLFCITLIIFALIRSMPGDPATIALSTMDPSRAIQKEDYERMKASYGLDKPVMQAYFIWAANVLRLNLDNSITHKQPVSTLIGDRLGPTLLLSITSTVITFLLAVPIGLMATVRAGKIDERGVSIVLYMLYSIPGFVAGLWMLATLSYRWELFPLMGMQSFEYDELGWPGKILDVVHHMVLPVITMSYASLAYYSRFVKSNMEEVIRQDYIRTARAKGAGQVRVVLYHAFRNTLIPFVTLLGLTLPALVGGSIIIETVFTWPGIGLLFYESIQQRDYPVIMGLTLMFSIVTLLGQLLADIMYAIVDPRIRYS